MDLPRRAEHGSGVKAVSAHHSIRTEADASSVGWTAELTVFESVAAGQDDHVFESALLAEFCGSKHGEVVGLLGFGLRIASEEDADGVLREEGLRISTALCGWPVGGGTTGCHQDHGTEERGQRTGRGRASHGGDGDGLAGLVHAEKV